MSSSRGVSSDDQFSILPSFNFRRRKSNDGDATSSAGSDQFSIVDGPYQVIEYDANDGDFATEFLNDINETSLAIEDDSPAAAALRANSEIHVSSFGKAARAVNMQTVRKLVKRATGTGNFGSTRGKPPRLPPSTLEMADQLPRRRRASLGDLQTVPEHQRSRITSTSLIESMADDEEHLPDNVVDGTKEASKQVLRDSDPHGYLRLLRWKRKNKAEKRKKDVTKSYMKGKVIDGEHELYTLSIAVMIGVRTSISKTNAEINDKVHKRWVTASDFQRTEKYEFRPKGGQLTPPHQLAHTFKFKDYSPLVFAYLRRLAGVNEFDFLLSVCGNANFIEFISNAKSGQFFFYSNDGRFMIKTMTNAESKFLRRALPQYFRHCVENPNSLMTRFFGMYRVKLYHLRRNVKFVIMNSVYYTDKFLQTFYDLKGSTVGRDAKPDQAVKKDNDLRRGLPGEALVLPPTLRRRFRDQIVDDCEFFNSAGVMDYSMLVGIHHKPFKNDTIATSGIRGSRRLSNPLLTHNFRAELEDIADPSESHNDDASLELDDYADNPKKAVHRKTLSDSIGAFFLENGLDEDDSSYILGSDKRPPTDMNLSFNEESERKKHATILKLYWPFHRLYDIHGHRRMSPAFCPLCSNKLCNCNEADDAKLLKDYDIPKFLPPLSDRKDGGLEMDTAGLKLPMTYKGSNGLMLHNGKIYYMGIIDILQEYTSRKAVESQYRYLQTGGKPDASCVPPLDYSTRFVEFFDSITRRDEIDEDDERAAEDSVEIDAAGNVSQGSFRVARIEL